MVASSAYGSWPTEKTTSLATVGSPGRTPGPDRVPPPHQMAGRVERDAAMPSLEQDIAAVSPVIPMYSSPSAPTRPACR